MNNAATHPVTLPTWLLIVIVGSGATGVGGGLAGLLGGGERGLRAEDEVRMVMLEGEVKSTDEALGEFRKELRTLRDNQIAICTALEADCN
tara:strand:+ start:388 stop:660 length:273 start_codon:yes stop_codon:yes gene_type:complete